MNIENIFQKIRLQGGRITKIRAAVLHALNQGECLLSQPAILEHLQTAGLRPNRSTIFRELFYLTRQHIIIKKTIADTDYYEIPCHHHHHLVCLQCHLIEKVTACGDLTAQEAVIAKNHHFVIRNHSLEFYGYCQNCQCQKI